MKSLNKEEAGIDWKKFGSIELNRFYDQISHNMSSVNQFASYVVFCSTDVEFETQNIDPNFVKLFKMSQILIEYLLKEFNRSKSCEKETKSQYNLIQENKKLRKLLEIHQKAMAYSDTVNSDHIQCPHCPKVFYDLTFLKTHISKRHPKNSLDSEGMLSLTQKIEKYQSVLVGDNKSIEQMRTQIQTLSEKLGKTELDLRLEKEARIKLEERIGHEVQLKTHEIQQSLREEIEEFKFTQRESLFEKDLHSNNQIIDNNSSDDSSDDNEDNHLQSSNTHKIEEMISIQAKEMIKLGNNVQKLVSHLTESLPLNRGEKPISKSLETNSVTNNKSEIQIKPQNKNVSKHSNKIQSKGNETQTKKVIEDSKQKVFEANLEDFKQKGFDADLEDSKQRSFDANLEDIDNENKELLSKKEKKSENKLLRTELENDVKKKLISFGIDFDTKGINEEKYLNAMKKMNAERKLLIEQNRHDYDFVSIENFIKKTVDKIISENKSQTVEYLDQIKSQERKAFKAIVKVEESKPKTFKSSETHSVEAIVHNSPLNDCSNTSDQSIAKVMESKSQTKPDLYATNTKIADTQTVRPKSALVSSSLKSGMNDRLNDNESEAKAKQQKHIRFSDHRIEHQISPNESTEDTSDEFDSMEFNNETNESNLEPKAISLAPIPAQRNRINKNFKINDEIKNDYTENVNYEIDDDLMDEILNSRPYSINKETEESDTNRGVVKSEKSSNQTKVQELAEMIEQQLSKRNSINKKPPIGSVNIMAAEKQKLSSKSLMVGLNTDSDDEFD